MPTPGLMLRKLADKSNGERITRYDPVTGAKKLVNPATPGDDHESWPLAGVQILNDPLLRDASISTNKVAEGVSEGWIELEGAQLVHRPGGPPGNPWRLTHTWTHASAIVFKTVNGDVRYKVVRQPDKYAVVDRDDSGKYPVEILDDKKKVTNEIYASGDTAVDMFYVLKLVN